jgi:pimeloyl-ACP methyl ester carboxylesterase
MTTPEILLVHGAWHGGWCFADLQAALDRRGFTSRTVDLPSSGGIAELADDSAVVRASLKANPARTLVVGHSYGGAVISDACATSGNVTGLVYLCAFMLPESMSVLDAVEHEVPPWIEVDMETGMATVPDPRTAFYLDCDPAAAAAAAARLKPQCMGAFAAESTEAAWKDLPSTYLICEQDNAIPVAAQEGMSGAAETVVRMDASHSPFMSRPDEVAEIIAKAAAG